MGAKLFWTRHSCSPLFGRCRARLKGHMFSFMHAATLHRRKCIALVPAAPSAFLFCADGENNNKRAKIYLNPSQLIAVLLTAHKATMFCRSSVYMVIKHGNITENRRGTLMESRVLTRCSVVPAAVSPSLPAGQSVGRTLRTKFLQGWAEWRCGVVSAPL